MDQLERVIEAIRESGWFVAPLIYLLIHFIRPIIFIPVILLFIAAGLIFGIVPGIVLSLVGIMLSSVQFYGLTKLMPSMTHRLVRMKKKLIGEERHVTIEQIAVLRLLPFIHFHLLSFIIYEKTSTFKKYMEESFYSSVMMVVIYTVIGQTITELSPLGVGMLTVLLIPLIYFLRKEENIHRIKQFLRLE
ncbi:putative membrane protein YdjX (TVP38/TMEM64 family) [Streptohalobacillus salinus]|uniref:TVP38/TMEM64 family membrane protein n=1 Tax=Streptohalobacillus salinus TaxID=621096 RepID=A0A2V3W962_9BACI|nr:VTT domain-containing protein [Streptohalobacillus salinus]PXW90076.1 putative membrane protein YdjX (TVP38/TMEM64 family) [Streptohalobacillus salinus]